MKIDKKMIDTAYDLAKAGINNIQIIEALHISKSSFYANSDLMDSIKKARAELRQNVSNSLLANATGGDTTSLIFLAKRLNLFSGDFHINLTSPKNALSSLEELANANISLEHKNSLKGIIGDYIKAYEVTELEDRISILENNKSNQENSVIVAKEPEF